MVAGFVKGVRVDRLIRGSEGVKGNFGERFDFSSIGIRSTEEVLGLLGFI